MDFAFARTAAAAVACAFVATTAIAHPVTVPFDYSKGVIEIEAVDHGARLHLLLDTGANPSVIDMARAERLGLKLDRAHVAAASGTGDTKAATAVPTTLTGLAVGRAVAAPFDALATDLTDLSKAYGSPLDGMLGYSYLDRRIVLIDYPGRRVTLFDRRAEAVRATASCRRRWTIPMRFLGDEGWPLIPLRVGDATVIATLDTGHNGTVNLYRKALDLPGVRASLVAAGESVSHGFNGAEKRTEWTIATPIGFGPFRLPPGASVTLAETEGSADTSLANAGNRLFAALNLRLLLDYKDRRIGFYGDCRN